MRDVATAPGLSREQRLAWLRLIRSENIGPVDLAGRIERIAGGRVQVIAG